MRLAEPPAGIGERAAGAQPAELGWLSDTVAGVVEAKTPLWWWISFGISFPTMIMWFSLIAYLIGTGVGVWGNMHPVMWAWDITNFVWWIGIGHAGTLISAILFLLRQRWRTSINRAAEAMTIFAVMCAGIYPLHPHRARLAGWWLLPLPNANSIWPQFRSPLMWDVFAVSTYFTVSVLFWYVGLIPDLAVMRDRAKTQDPQIRLRPVRAGVDGIEPALEQLRKGLPDPGGAFDAAGAVGALYRVIGLLRLAIARLAYDHLSALLCCGGDFLRIRHGA